jgi:hypothetical protein
MPWEGKFQKGGGKPSEKVFEIHNRLLTIHGKYLFLASV